MEEVHAELTDAKRAKDEAETLLHDVEKREELQNDTLRETRTKLINAEDERHELEKIQAEHMVYVEKLQEKHDENTLDLRRALSQEKKRVNQLVHEQKRCSVLRARCLVLGVWGNRQW